MFGEDSRRVEGDKEGVVLRGGCCELLSRGSGGGALGLGGAHYI